MIVFQINIKLIPICVNERNSPIASYSNAPRAFSVASETMESITRNVQIIKGFCLIENKQNPIDAVAHVRTDAALVSSLVELL